MFIKITFKDSSKVKRIIKMQSISVSIDITKVVDFCWKNYDINKTQGMCRVIPISIKLKGCVVWFQYFLDIL